MTKDELLELMKSGQLNLQSPGGGPAAPGGGPRAGHQDRPGPFPGSPRGASALPAVPGRAPGSRAGSGCSAGAAAPVVDDEEERKAKAGRLGSAADRAGRRARRSERAGERRVTSPVAVSALLVDEEDDAAHPLLRRPEKPGPAARRRCAAENAHRDRTADHDSEPFRGDRGQGPGLDPQADGNESDGHDQRHARRRAGRRAGHGVRQRARRGSPADSRGRDAGCIFEHGQFGKPPASAAGHHDPGPR